jgi:predicted DNA-binding ribbon-helix-helix protein
MKKTLMLVDPEFRTVLKSIAKMKKITVKSLTKRLANEKGKIEIITR